MVHTFKARWSRITEHKNKTEKHTLALVNRRANIITNSNLETMKTTTQNQMQYACTTFTILTLALCYRKKGFSYKRQRYERLTYCVRKKINIDKPTLPRSSSVLLLVFVGQDKTAQDCERQPPLCIRSYMSKAWQQKEIVWLSSYWANHHSWHFSKHTWELKLCKRTNKGMRANWGKKKKFGL